MRWSARRSARPSARRTSSSSARRRTAEEAFALAPVLRPDILLLDIDLPGMNGIQMVQELAPRLPETKIVMLTVSTRSAT